MVGQLFEVDDATLAAMDQLERVDDPRWYQRRPIRVRPHPGAAADEVIDAWVYSGGEAGFAGAQVHAGPLAEYTLALAVQHTLGLP